MEESNEPLTLLTEKLSQLEYRKQLVMFNPHVIKSYTKKELDKMRDDLESRITEFKIAVHWLTIREGKDNGIGKEK